MARDSALLVLRGGEARREWVLGERTVIGRDPDCDIALVDRQVSRQHAVVRRTAEGFVVSDEASKNGTWLNGSQLATPVLLTDGDELSIAAVYKLYFVDNEATAPLVFEARGLRVDPVAKLVYVNGLPLDPPLTQPQLELMWALYEAAGQTVSRDLLVERVWPYSEGAGVTDQALDAMVRRVRIRLAEADPEHPYILTVRGYGYKLQSP
jgi:DNA-binding response OmpR family regulator